MSYTLPTHFATHNYTLLHTGLSAYLHTFTHTSIEVCNVCRCVVSLCVCSWFAEGSMKMLFRKEMTLPAWRAQR
jgi:hypothetical protein